MSRRPASARLAGLLVLAVLGSGCAAGAAHVAPNASGARDVIVVLPLENLSGRAEYGERYSRMTWTTVGQDGRFEVVDPGQVDATLVELRIRSAGALTTDQITRAADKLHARWVLAGTLLEAGSSHTPDGDVPTFSLALRLLDGRTGRVEWTDLRARSGEDRETVFGWGREGNLERLAQSTIHSLVQSIRIPATPDSLEGK